MPKEGRARDLHLLDALDALERLPFEGTVWRVVREGRDPLEGHASAGRWDPGTFEVLYTSLEADGAQAEMSFQLSRQPVYPSQLRFRLHEIAVAAHKTLRFADLRALAPFGVEQARYADLAYLRTQEIGDAAHFLGFDGIVAPSARWPCLNLVLFTDRLASDNLRLTRSDPADLVAWRSRAQSKGG
jgi:RES domain-containing protein